MAKPTFSKSSKHISKRAPQPAQSASTPPSNKTTQSDAEMDIADDLDGVCLDVAHSTSNSDFDIIVDTPATLKRSRYACEMEDEVDFGDDEPATIRRRSSSPRRDNVNEDADIEDGEIEFKGQGSAADQHPSNANFPGVTADNVPIIPKGTINKTIRYYAPCPIVRSLDWREPDGPNVGEGKPWTGGIGDLEAAFVQTRGAIAKSPCESCSAGKGLWKSCVERLGSKNNGICANCWQAGGFCTNFNKQAGDASAPRAHGFRFRFRNPRPGPLNVRVDSTRMNAARENYELRNAPEVIPFPLGAEAINNLPLLKRARQDLCEHIARIDARIDMLEMKEKLQKEAGGEIAWDEI
ncbi:DUF3716 domain-containing protein [Aspergillus mulundensis]|uniref:Uncharacterized protein n=1 Tax=Aspergillus mulundensis TaxID=1810919 RepID=A0A3D8RYU3_9EURO|nr:hypothetical protein DSM5745_06064 [Aspergillus mulundensis]RDW79212.1 hypothetical protein DSM5745_06064 [Aspergillus mulundensis]